MSSIIRRTAVLGFARIAQRALTLLSPIFMVRLLSVDQYGEYRDFLLYAVLLHTLVEFSINTSLAYFIPKDPDNERLYFAQASFLVFVTSLVTIGFVLAFGGYVPTPAFQSFKYPLCLYIFVIANLDAWEVYWIVKKQTTNILYYSMSRLALRTTVVIIAAYLTRDVSSVIWALVVFEALRLLIMGAYATNTKLLTASLDFSLMKSQFGYFGPLGAAGLVYILNMYMGQLFISAKLGAAALAVYTIGTYLYPLVHIFRGSIGDVIMPEIVSRRDEPPKVALELWQRATVVYCAVMFPMAVLFFYYANVVVNTLFTSAYAEAIPIFQIFVLLLIRECFDFSVPLRVVNRTKTLFTGTILSLVINLTLMLFLFERFGLLGPPIAMIITRFLAGFYLAAYVIKYCNYSIVELLPWEDVAKTAILCLACLPILLLADLLPMNVLARTILFGTVYVAVFFGLLLKFGNPAIRDFFMNIRARRQAKTVQ